MTIQVPSELNLSEIDPEEQGARYWFERYCEQRVETERLTQRVKELEEQFETLSEKLKKVTGRSSETSSQPPSADGPKKRNRDQQKPQRKRGPKYNHPGTTRNGFGWIDHTVLLEVERCPVCGGEVGAATPGNPSPAGGRTGTEPGRSLGVRATVVSMFRLRVVGLLGVAFGVPGGV